MEITSPVQVLQIVAFLDTLAAGLIVPQLPNHARSLGCNHLLIGAMGALYSGFQLISGPVTGSLSDIKGRRFILLMTLLLSGIAYVFLGLTSSIVLFLGLRSFLGIFKQTQLLTKAAAPDYEKDAGKRSVIYGRLATLSSAGMSIGPILGGHLMEMYQDYGFTILCFIVGIIFAINLGLIKRLPTENLADGKGKQNEITVTSKMIETVTKNLKQSVDEFYKIDWTVYWDVFLLKLFVTLCMSVYYCNFALFLKIKHQVTPANLGYIISFQQAVGFVCTYFIGYINNIYKDDRDFTHRNFHVCLTLTVSLLGMVLAPSVHLYIVMLVPLAIGSAVGRIVSLQMIVSKDKTGHRGTVMGAAGSIRSLSGVVAPLIAGVIGQYVGVLYVSYLSISFAAAALMLSYRNRKQSIIEKTKKD